jgi:hypothetical protein
MNTTDLASLPGNSRIARRLLWAVLSGILLLIVALAAMAWGLSHRNQVLEHRLSALFPKGGAIELEFAPYAYTPPAERKAVGGSWQTGISFRDTPSPRLGWLVRRFGACAFAHVRHIKILSNRFDDNDVPYLLALPEVRELDVSHTALTDAGVVKLTTLPHLVRLRLEHVQLAPETLRLLANCRELKELDLKDTGADEATVSSLQRALPGCQISW